MWEKTGGGLEKMENKECFIFGCQNQATKILEVKMPRRKDNPKKPYCSEHDPAGEIIQELPIGEQEEASSE